MNLADQIKAMPVPPAKRFRLDITAQEVSVLQNDLGSDFYVRIIRTRYGSHLYHLNKDEIFVEWLSNALCKI